MIARILAKALPFVLALLGTAAHAQDVNWNVVLTTVNVGNNGPLCLPLATETINGASNDLSRGAGLSMEICPWVYNNSSDYGEISAQVPPIQPWDPNGDWYQWNVPTAQVTRGPITATGDVWTYRETDTFNVTIDLTYYTVWPQAWDGTLIRTLRLHEKCGRWPCTKFIPLSQCTRATNCSYSFTDESNTAVLTGTFPVPTPPAGAQIRQNRDTYASLYRCGSGRKACFR